MQEQNEHTGKRFLFVWIIGTMFMVFFGRLVQLQVLYQDEYGKKSEENSIRPIARDPIRGYMFDRNGKLIVDNRPSYTVTITPAEFHESVIPYLASVLDLDTAFIRERLNKGKIYNRFAPVKVKRDIDFKTLSVIEENREKLIGVDYQIESKRYYPTQAKAAHLFGYTKEVSDRLVQEQPNQYRPGDLIGATGLEAAYERYLRGEKGFEFITVNAKGEMLGAFNEGKSNIPIKEGNDLLLAIDAGVQALAESLLSDKRGAVVAIDPTNGGIIALASKPDYDLTSFGGITPADVWNALNTDPMKPLFNRATMTRYQPGSTYKMLLALAALQENVIPTSWAVNCTGGFRFGTRVFKDLHVHNYTGMVESIEKSCNVYYYQLMLKTGFEKWTEYGRKFGFGSPTGIDILEENSGLLPSEEYYNRVYGAGRWTQGYLVSLGIGQGELGVSPLQMACYAMTLANKGHYYRPHVVDKVRIKETKQTEPVPIEARTIEINDTYWNLVREGMNLCVNSPGGTANLAKVQGVVVSGKTGTAQNPHGKDHAWFVGFAPFDNPKIAICVLVENAGFGGVFAAPIAGMCIEQYLYGKLIRKSPGDLNTLVQSPASHDDIE